MIHGIGIDIVQIGRILELTQKFGPAFANKILSKDELQLYSEHLDDVRFLAKRFALKEAVAKALGTGIGEYLSFQDITITKDESGKPICTIANSNLKVLVSVSDETDYVVAQAIIY